MFNYDDKFFISGAYRKEGSSRFGENNRWGDFYSISGGADIAHIVTLPLDILKVRVGYGLTGALPPGLYDYATLLQENGVTVFNDGTSDRNVRLFGYRTNANPDLRWEQKSEFNVGVDFGVLGNKLTGSLDFYTRSTKDVIFLQAVSMPPNLADRTWLNLGEMSSKGFEALVNYTAFTKADFSWTTGITYSMNRSKVVALNGSKVFLGGGLGPPGLNGIAPIQAAVGEPLGLITAPIYQGLKGAEAPPDSVGKPRLKPLVDANGDGSINNLDWPVVGSGVPDFELAWNNSLTYKHFDLSFTFRGAFGHSLINVNRAYYEVPENSSNYNLVVTKYYDPARTGNEAYNSYYVEKADFFKLDNISLGYNFKFTSSPFKLLRLYVTGQNLFVITDYTGVDPEVHYGASGGVEALFPGLEDRNSYFRSRTYTAGLNLTF